MTATEISVVLWGITNLGGLAALYFKHGSRIQHLEDTKEPKNGLAKNVAELTTEIKLANHKLDEQGKKITVIFEKVPCLQPECRKPE